MLSTPLPATREKMTPVAAIQLRFHLCGILEQVWFRGARLELERSIKEKSEYK